MSLLECPNCGHDPRGDSEEFVSGGGWIVDHSVTDGIHIEEYRCPICREIVFREEQGGDRLA